MNEEITRPSPSQRPLDLSALHDAAMRYRKYLLEDWIQAHGCRVQMGPFNGMILAQQSSRGDGDILPKLIGTYEMELHPIIEKITQRPYRRVINVGCGDGFYAVGLAQRIPSSDVIAIDIEPRALDVSRMNAQLNDTHLTLLNRCSIEDLTSLLSPEPLFLLIDCEGYELELLDPKLVPELSKADMIVECHDFIHQGITDTLFERFTATHSISNIFERARDLDNIPKMEKMSLTERTLATSEFRPVIMNWLHLQSNAFPLG